MAAHTDLSHGQPRGHRHLAERLVAGHRHLPQRQQQAERNLADGEHADGDLTQSDHPEGETADGDDADGATECARLRIAAHDQMEQRQAEQPVIAPVFASPAWLWLRHRLALVLESTPIVRMDYNPEPFRRFAESSWE